MKFSIFDGMAVAAETMAKCVRSWMARWIVGSNSIEDKRFNVHVVAFQCIFLNYCDGNNREAWNQTYTDILGLLVVQQG
jgi:hypothetical protein